MKRFVPQRWMLVLLGSAIVVAVAVHFIAAQAERISNGETYPTTNYTRIEDGLYLGGILAAPPSGVKAVLNVGETKDPYAVEVHRWEPIPDLGPAPGLDWLREQVKFIDEQVRAGRPLYIHCRAGVNRSAMVLAAYFMWRDGLSRDDALARIKEKRNRIGPFPAYMKYLAEWEKALK